MLGKTMNSQDQSLIELILIDAKDSRLMHTGEADEVDAALCEYHNLRLELAYLRLGVVARQTERDLLLAQQGELVGTLQEIDSMLKGDLPLTASIKTIVRTALTKLGKS